MFVMEGAVTSAVYQAIAVAAWLYEQARSTDRSILASLPWASRPLGRRPEQRATCRRRFLALPTTAATTVSRLRNSGEGSMILSGGCWHRSSK